MPHPSSQILTDIFNFHAPAAQQQEVKNPVQPDPLSFEDFFTRQNSANVVVGSGGGSKIEALIDLG